MGAAESISFIIPCFHENPEIVISTVKELRASVEGRIDSEIIVVNDGNGIEAFPVFENDVFVIHHEVNMGYGASLMSGILASSFEWIGIVDADGTYPVSHFSRFLEFTSNHDMVVGSRRLGDLPSLRRVPKYLLLKFAGYMADHRIPDLNSGMRIFRKCIVMRYRRLFPKRFSFTTTLTMICLANFYQVRFIDIPYYARTGSSAINPISDTMKFFSLVMRLALYFRPLRFFVPLSMLTFAAASARALRDILAVNHFGGLAMVLFFMAFQIFFFGLLAEIINKK